MNRNQPDGTRNTYPATGPNARPEVREWWEDIAFAGLETGETDHFGEWAAWDGSHAVAVTDAYGFREVLSFPSIRQAKAYFDTVEDDYATFYAGFWGEV